MVQGRINIVVVMLNKIEKEKPVVKVMAFCFIYVEDVARSNISALESITHEIIMLVLRYRQQLRNCVI